MKIFVISLLRSKDRRESISGQLQSLNLPFEYIDAVNGLEMTPEDVRQVCHDSYFQKYLDVEWITEGVVAAAMSHKVIYQRIIDNNLDYALILEDDVLLSEEFPSVLDALKNFLREDRAITLFCQTSVPDKNIYFDKESAIPVIDKFKLYKPLSLTKVGSGAAYIISRKIAEKYLEIQTPLRFCPDWWENFLDEGCYGDFRFLYPLIAKPGEFASTINYRKEHLIVDRTHRTLKQFSFPRKIVERVRQDRFSAYIKYQFV